MVMMLPMAPSMCPMIVTATAATTTTTLWVATWCPAVGVPTRDDNVGAGIVVVGAIQLPCRLPHRSQPQRVEIGLRVHVLCTVPGSRQTFHLSPLPCRTCCSAQGFAGAVPHESALQATRNTEVRAHACCRRYRATHTHPHTQPHTQPHTRTHTHNPHFTHAPGLPIAASETGPVVMLRCDSLRGAAIHHPPPGDVVAMPTSAQAWESYWCCGGWRAQA